MLVWGGSTAGYNGVSTFTYDYSGNVAGGTYSGVLDPAKEYGIPFNGAVRFYDPVSESWTAEGAPNGPGWYPGQSAIWTGSQLIVFGGLSLLFDSTGNYLGLADSGGIFTP